MRGIGLSISRLSAARFCLAGAAILASTAMRSAHGEVAGGSALHSDETAMAVPRINPPAGSSGVGLPQPLAPSEAARVRRIFALQARGRIPEAVAETAQLSDDTLLGPILADRYLAQPTRVVAPALSAWLGRYADLPDACAIYALLLKKLPAGTRAPPPPQCAGLGNGGALPDMARLAASPARAALQRGHDAAALRLGREGFRRSHGQDGEAAYVAGLAAWQAGQFALSARLFDEAAAARPSSAALRAASSFWSARAYGRLGDAVAAHARLLRAAAEPHTLHGMLARKQLKLRQPAPPASPVLAEADVDAIAQTPQGRRAFALLQVGQNARAAAELRVLWPDAQSDPALSRALFLVAGAAGLSDLVADLAGVVDATEAELPVPDLHPAGGYLLNPALVYAVAHVESNFDTHAVSSAGAYGLMQLRPTAVHAVLGRVRNGQKLLRDASQNLRLGQAYLAYLAQGNVAGNDLLAVLASYNAGPGAVQKWAMQAQGDPLMYIELIPNDETRQFVQRALRNLWQYAARFDLPAPSLNAMAKGAWPRFAPELAVADSLGQQFAALSVN